MGIGVPGVPGAGDRTGVPGANVCEGGAPFTPEAAPFTPGEAPPGAEPAAPAPSQIDAAIAVTIIDTRIFVFIFDE